MSFAHIVWQEQMKIIQNSHLAFVKGMHDTWNYCAKYGRQPQEPDFVASLVLDSAPILYQVFSAIFQQHGLQFSLAAVFCHQTPKVQFVGMSKTSCEVGDLLFVHVHTPRTGETTRNALLYQAKKSSKQPYRIDSSEADQLRLYATWPPFEYYKSPPLTGQQRDITPKLPHTGAQYMLIDDRPPGDPQSGLMGIPGTYPIGCCMADEYLHNHNHLAREIFDFLLLRSGRAFIDQSTSSSTNGWSKLVWDLLITGLHKAFNRRNSGRLGAPRHAGGPVHLSDGCFFARTTGATALTTAASILGHDSTENLFADTRDVPPDRNWPQDNFPDPYSGVSIVLFETFEEEGG
jgi:hypothetical protein